MEEKNDAANSSLTAMSIDALRSSQQGFEELQSLFKKCGELFDKGDDAGGLELLQSDLVPKLMEFANFLASFMGNSAVDLDAALCAEFSTTCDSFQEVLKTLLSEMEKSNFTEVGDILRFDLADLISSISRLFPRLAENLESGKK